MSKQNRARQARNSSIQSGPTRRSSTPASASGVGYRQTPNRATLAPLRSGSQRVRAKPVQKPAVRRSIAHTSPPSRAVTRSKALNVLNRPEALFGGWELPTPTARVARAATALKTALLSHCDMAKARRKAIFATRSHIKASTSPRLHFSNLKGCK